ncbi:hypothetical protein BX600DRAFT_459109 [Xylariales sp. PMI_506]|nr:hypothetical protein BX600DRAFT_459109 [Xylariales sp. PMI_506]
MSSSESGRSESPKPAAEADSSKKRKSQIDEIEVDLNLPEPPSKKAKRLLKKGKPLPVKPASDDEAEDNDGLNIPSGKDPKDKKSKRSEYGIWIGNLPFNLTRVELFKWFVESSGGVIKEENITRVNLPASKLPPREPLHGRAGDEKPQRWNKGFAYVDFDTEGAAIAAMSLTETDLRGRNVLIKNSSSFEGRPQKEAAGAAGAQDANGAGAAAVKNKDASRKIYVGNLGFQTSEDDLRAHFDKCGEIEWVKVATFEDTGKCKGYGWVKFKEVESAEAAAKGFVKIKEEIETEDDFKDGKAEGEDGEEPEEKKFKMRKWWVNRLQGRPLKIEFAEDDQVRYKKRFGKDAPARRERPPPRAAGEEGAGGENENARPARPARPAYSKPKEPQYGDAQTATYLTGAVVKSQGKKTTFD